MELQIFIRTTLLEIMAGVRDAQAAWHAESNGAGVINPAFGGPTENHVKVVTFDVAVTAETGSRGEANASIKVWGVGAGGKLSDTATNSTVSRIQFEVPIIPPVISVDDQARWSPIPYSNKGVV